MPITRDGITCRLPPNPVHLGVGALLVGAGGWLASAATLVGGVALILVGTLVLVNQIGNRRVRVIATKLVVEDEHLIVALLIGPIRSRVTWAEVRDVRVDGRSLRLETSGSPFVTAQGASLEDLASLKARVDAAITKERAGGSAEAG